MPGWARQRRGEAGAASPGSASRRHGWVGPVLARLGRSWRGTARQSRRGLDGSELARRGEAGLSRLGAAGPVTDGEARQARRGRPRRGRGIGAARIGEARRGRRGALLYEG